MSANRATRVALVTGGGGAIGSETCRALASDGFRVAVADKDLAAGRAVLPSLSGAGHDAFAMDVTAEQSVADAFGAVTRTLGSIGVLVCVAGGAFITAGVRPTLETTTIADWVDTETLNVRGVFLCIREFARRYDAAAGEGRIITVSSTAGLIPGSPTGIAYSTAKAAVIALTRSTAFEVAARGITANVVVPGMIDTPTMRASITQEQFDIVARRTPNGRIGQTDDVATTVAFLASDAARHLTGCTIPINGGYHITLNT